MFHIYPFLSILTDPSLVLVLLGCLSYIIAIVYLFIYLFFNKVSVQFSSVPQSCPTLCIPMDSSTPAFPVHHHFSELDQTHVHWVGEAIQPPHPLLSPSPPTFNLSSIRVFSNEALHIRWPNYWIFTFSISPSNEYSGLTSFRMDWLDLLEVQGTLKSLLQHQSSKASIL